MKPVLAVVIPLLLVTACSPSQPDPVPVPSSPNTSVSTASPSPTVNQEELYAEAEQVFWRMREIASRYEIHGDFSGFPTEMNEVAMGEYLSAKRALYDFMAEKQWRGDPAEIPVIHTEPYPYASYEGSEATLHTCSDGRNTHTYGSDGSVTSQGTVVEAKIYFKHDTDSRLKIFAQEYREVTECPVSLI